MSRVHSSVDWRPDCGPWSMVDHSHGRRLTLTGTWARRHSRASDLTVVALGPREGDGDPYPGWHKGGSSGASSMRRCLRHGGEMRRRAASVVWRGGDGGTFYRGGQGRWPARRQWCAIKRRPVMEEETKGLTLSDAGKWRPRDAGSVHPFTRGERRRAAAPGAVVAALAWGRRW
jgi:hypothetical protein